MNTYSYLKFCMVVCSKNKKKTQNEMFFLFICLFQVDLVAELGVELNFEISEGLFDAGDLVLVGLDFGLDRALLLVELGIGVTHRQVRKHLAVLERHNVRLVHDDELVDGVVHVLQLLAPLGQVVLDLVHLGVVLGELVYLDLVLVADVDVVVQLALAQLLAHFEMMLV